MPQNRSSPQYIEERLGSFFTQVLQAAVRRKYVRFVQRAKGRMSRNGQKRTEIVNMKDVTLHYLPSHIEKHARWEKKALPVCQLARDVAVVANLDSSHTVFLNSSDDVGGNSAPPRRIGR